MDAPVKLEPLLFAAMMLYRSVSPGDTLPLPSASKSNDAFFCRSTVMLAGPTCSKRVASSSRVVAFFSAGGVVSICMMCAPAAVFR